MKWVTATLVQRYLDETVVCYRNFRVCDVQSMLRKLKCSSERVTICSPGTKNNDILFLASLLEKGETD